MSISITVDVDKLGFNDKLSPAVTAAIRSSLQTSLAIIRDRWQTDIQNKLKGTRATYLQGLDFNSIRYPLDQGGFSGSIELHGKLPRLLETGVPPFDMKVGFGKSKKVTKTKDGGWYLTIPMRHSTPGSKMYGAPMPKDIYNLARRLGDGERLSVPGGGDKSWNGYQHKGNIYNGLQRIIKDNQKSKMSRYVTFRRVSNQSDPMSWWHPGLEGVRELEKLTPFAESTFVDILTNNLNGLA